MNEKIGQDFQIDIERLSFGGMGLGHLNGQVVFIAHTAPGDKVRTKIVTMETDYLIGTLEEIIEPSPLRIKAACPYFGECGGCQTTWPDVHDRRSLRGPFR